MIYLVSFYGMSLVSLFGLAFWRRFAMVFTAIFAFGIAALRFSSGFDYLPYYRTIVTGEWQRFEPLNQVLMYLAHVTSPQLYFVVTSAVVVFFNLATILHVDKYRVRLSRLAFLAFLSFPVGLLESFNMVRQLCGVSIFVYAFVRRDNKVLSLALFGLAWMFHESAIIFLPVLILAMIREWRLPTWAYVVLLACSLFLGPVLQYAATTFGFYAHYFTDHASDIGLRMAAFFAAVFLGILVFYKKRLQVNLANELNLMFVGVCCNLALAQYGTHLARASWYGIGIYPVLIGAALAPGGLVIRVLAVYGMALLFAFQLYLAARHPVWDGLNQYQIAPALTAAEKAETLERFYQSADRN